MYYNIRDTEYKRKGQGNVQCIKRGLAAFLTIVILMATIPMAMAASFTGTINANKVNFRKKASLRAECYCQLNKKTKVSVSGVSGEFYKVTYNGQTGYIMRDFVTVSSAARKALVSTPLTGKSKYADITTIAKLGAPPDATEKGYTGEQVEKLQQALKIKGYFNGTVDGKYGNATVSAVKAYQKAIGLSQTGKADHTTIACLFNKTRITSVSSDSKMKGITRISQITPVTFCKKGDSGKNVLALQQALKIKGYYKVAIDSKFGNMTVEAVKAFQKANGLTVDGIVGNYTIAALFNEKSR